MIKKIKYNKYNVEKKSVTYTNGERGENSKVKEYEILGEIKWWKELCLADMSRREKSHWSISKYTLPDPEPMLQAKKVLSWS